MFLDVGGDGSFFEDVPWWIFPLVGIPMMLVMMVGMGFMMRMMMGMGEWSPTAPPTGLLMHPKSPHLTKRAKQRWGHPRHTSCAN